MHPIGSTPEESKMIDDLVAHYRLDQNQRVLKLMLSSIRAYLSDVPSDLTQHIHSSKWRIKDPNHLKDKLYRKLGESKQENKLFDITKENLFSKVNDLIGARLLHLHTKQMAKIDPILRALFAEAHFKIVEGPLARTWDDESRKFFEGIGIQTKQSGDTMYTSVHYILDSTSSTRCTAEIQVRTLAEELWGEVTHTIDYPHPSESVGCREQIRALARVTSSCSRLVDSIFATHADHITTKNHLAPAAVTAPPTATA